MFEMQLWRLRELSPPPVRNVEKGWKRWLVRHCRNTEFIEKSVRYLNR
jgi:hypothetical protein